MGELKIDIYNHVMPRAVADRIRELAPGRGDMVKRVTSIPMLYDMEARIRIRPLRHNRRDLTNVRYLPTVQSVIGVVEGARGRQRHGSQIGRQGRPGYRVEPWHQIGECQGPCHRGLPPHAYGAIGRAAARLA
jgi:hypothetical protein